MKCENLTEVAAVFSSDGGNLPARDGRIHHNTDRALGWVKNRVKTWKDHPFFGEKKCVSTSFVPDQIFFGNLETNSSHWFLTWRCMRFPSFPNFKTPTVTSLKTAPSVGRWVATARESQEVVAWLKSDKWERKTHTKVSFCLGFDRRVYLHSMYISCKQLQLQLQHIHVYSIHVTYTFMYDIYIFSICTSTMGIYELTLRLFTTKWKKPDMNIQLTPW